MVAPKYQSLKKEDIPVVSLENDAGDVRIIAGDFQGVKGSASTHSPINVWDFRLLPGKTVQFTVLAGHRTILFVRRGSIQVGDSAAKHLVGNAQAALLTDDETTIILQVWGKINFAKSNQNDTHSLYSLFAVFY